MPHEKSQEFCLFSDASAQLGEWRIRSGAGLNRIRRGGNPWPPLPFPTKSITTDIDGL